MFKCLHLNTKELRFWEPVKSLNVENLTPDKHDFNILAFLASQIVKCVNLDSKDFVHISGFLETLCRFLARTLQSCV